MRGSSILFLALVAACGGASQSDLFNGNGGGGGGSDGSTSGNDASTNGDSGTASDAGTQADATTQHDSGVAMDSATPRDTGVVDLVHCQGTPGCKVGTDACCRKVNGTGFTYACAPLGTCEQGPGDLEIPCDKQRDCDLLGAPGGVCCVTGTQTGASDVACRLPSECTSQQGRTPICDPQMANACPAQTQCLPSQTTIPGYSICK